MEVVFVSSSDLQENKSFPSWCSSHYNILKIMFLQSLSPNKTKMGGY